MLSGVAAQEEMGRKALTLLRDAFTDSAPTRPAMEQLLGQGMPGHNRGWLPVDVLETATAVEIRTALPGILPRVLQKLRASQ